MPSSDYVSDLEGKLHRLDQAIERATDKLGSGAIAEKTEALAELTRLRRRHDELVARIAEAKAKGAAEWSALHMSLQEEADALSDTMDKWLTRLT